MITREIRFPFDYNMFGVTISKGTWFSIDDALYRQLREAGWSMEERTLTPAEEKRSDLLSRSGPPVIRKELAAHTKDEKPAIKADATPDKRKDPDAQSRP